MSVLTKRWLPILAAAAAIAIPAAPAAARPALRLRATAPVARASAAGPIVLGGLSARGWPVVVALPRNTRRLGAIVIALDMSCTSGDSFTTRDTFANLAIGPTGLVKAVRSFQPVTDSGVTVTGSHVLTGRLDRRRMRFSGWWHLHLDFETSGAQTDQCDSGRVNFRAAL